LGLQVEGNTQEFEQGRRRRMGADADQYRRIKYRRIKYRRIDA
jgi:hypothetical protein